MSKEAKISGDILEEARKGLSEKKSVEMGREYAAGVNETLNKLMDDNVLRDSLKRPIHDGRGWSHITVYLKAKEGEEQIHVNMIRHIRSKRIDMLVYGLGTTIHVHENKFMLATNERVPQRPLAMHESMRIPTGSSTPDAPPYEEREANLGEVSHIMDFTKFMTTPENIDRIGNKL